MSYGTFSCPLLGEGVSRRLTGVGNGSSRSAPQLPSGAFAPASPQGKPSGCTITHKLWYTQKLSNNLCAGSATRYCSSKRAVREGYIGEGACLCGSKVLAPPLCVFSFPYFFCTSKRNRACGAMQAPITEKIPYFTSSTLRGPILFACPKRIGRKRTFKGRALYKTPSPDNPSS